MTTAQGENVERAIITVARKAIEAESARRVVEETLAQLWEISNIVSVEDEVKKATEVESNATEKEDVTTAAGREH